MDIAYVLCHPEKEKARYERLIPHLLEIGLKPEICAPTWGSDLTAEQIFKAYDPYLQRPLPAFTFKAACLSRGEISLCMNFLEAARQAVAKGGPALILESDVWLRPDFMDRLASIITRLPEDWDYVSLGEGCNTRPVGGSYYAPTRLYRPPHQWVFRCTDSMLLSERFLKAVTTTMVPFKECLDWELNWQMMLHKGVALWADPPLAEQGTWNGREGSSLP